MNARALTFGLNCAIASILALFVAFSFELPNPSWAVVTVFLTSQPITQGGVWGKAFYRFVGTIIALTVALIIIPNLVDAPELMIGALAAWLGLCLYFSLLDRSPRAYAFMLSGYTAILIGLPVITADPSTIFDTAVYRTEEILVGVGSAALVHGLFSMHSAQRAFQAKLSATLADARGWIAGAMTGSASREERGMRRRLAADISELVNLAMALRFEVPELHAYAGLVRTLEDRLVSLLPLLSAIESRREALLEFGPLDPRIEALAQEAGDRVRSQELDAGAFEGLLAACTRIAPSVDAQSSPQALLEFNFVNRLALLIAAWRDCVDLARAVREPGAGIEPRLAQLAATHAPRALHLDHGIAFWSALVAALSVVVAAAVGILLEWPPAISSIGLAAVFCSLFATLDDPTPPQARLIVWSFVAVAVAAVYVFAILPGVDGFLELALCLFPLFAAFGYFMTQPKFALQSVSVMLVSTTLIGLQPAYRADFVTFITIALATNVGALTALLLTQLLRVISADVSTRRLLRRGWADLAKLAHRPRRYVMAQFAMRMLDRLTLLTPRAARATQSYELRLGDVLRDLQIGFNLSELTATAAELPEAVSRPLKTLRLQLGEHFDALSEGAAAILPKPSIADLEAVTRELLALPRSECRDRAIAAAVGLRHTLLSFHRQADLAGSAP